jgi:hypothetical protein
LVLLGPSNDGPFFLFDAAWRVAASAHRALSWDFPRLVCHRPRSYDASR